RSKRDEEINAFTFPKSFGCESTLFLISGSSSCVLDTKLFSVITSNSFTRTDIFNFLIIFIQNTVISSNSELKGRDCIEICLTKKTKLGEDKIEDEHFRFFKKALIIF